MSQFNPKISKFGMCSSDALMRYAAAETYHKKKKKKRNLGPCARSKIAVIIVAQSSLRLLPFVSGESWMGITWCFFGVFFFFFCILVSMWHEYQSYLCGRPRVQFPTIVFFIFCTILSRHFRLVVLKIYLFT